MGVPIDELAAAGRVEPLRGIDPVQLAVAAAWLEAGGPREKRAARSYLSLLARRRRWLVENPPGEPSSIPLPRGYPGELSQIHLLRVTGGLPHDATIRNVP